MLKMLAGRNPTENGVSSAVISFEEVGSILDGFADELPEEFYRELNGGIRLLPDTKLHPESRESAPLYILGEYHREGVLGQHINIYYGSFLRAYAHLPQAMQAKKLKKILLHEFTHHLEYMAGEKGLEIEDARDLEQYLRGSGV